jgi:5'-methylthioadenosine phosphorylase
MMEAEIGIIGGTGLYSLLDKAEEVEVKTKYGKTSSPIMLGKIKNRKVAFISRHGNEHTIPPHKVPYIANIDALASLGVKKVIGTAASGSLTLEYKPGDIVFFDQYMNMTHGRRDTFFEGPEVVHLSAPEPYCKSLRKTFVDQADNLNIRYHVNSTVVVVNGPRFSTKAESRFFASQGFDTINMTQYPEVTLARERGMCYLGIGMITDYDNGLEGREDIKPVTFAELQRVFKKNDQIVKDLINTSIPEVGKGQKACGCGKLA